MKLWIILLSTLAFAQSIISQQLVPSVISSSGGFYSNSSGMLSFTTGELAAVESYSSTGYILTQGFQQPWDIGTYITEHPHPNFSFGIYPNPSDGNFYLLTEANKIGLIEVTISNILGREVMREVFYPQGRTDLHLFELSGMPQGMYILFITTQKDYSSFEHHFVHKIQFIK